GNSNNTVRKGELSIGDAFIKNRLESALGHQTKVMWDETPQADMRSATDSADLVVVLESVTSATLLAKFRGTPTPILNCEAFLQDDLGLTAAGPSGDPGPPSQFEFGVMDNQTALDIKDPLHPLAAGLRDRVVIYTSPKEVNWGKVGPGAKVVASLAGDAAGTSIYVYAKGAILFDGALAAGTRIGFFLEDDNKTGTPNLLTPDGLKLFDAAVRFALESPSTAAVGGFPAVGRRNPVDPHDGAPNGEDGSSDALGRLQSAGSGHGPGFRSGTSAPPAQRSKP
ncbi:MAG: hypothetical protein ABIW76_23030, partial [Fibrobacteria bacterium]